MKVKMFISLFAIGLLAFNFSMKRCGEGKKGVALQNIAVMQANAGEMYCNLETDDPCTITAPSGHVGTSKGYLICEF
ncbi:MAG: hypothetical protein LBG15_14110 [Dysgonamonadaceae bacterium]|jgi:hypothetical protein|nr:hypothetical protein [Dysgonamonadaceae bacterium]